MILGLVDAAVEYVDCLSNVIQLIQLIQGTFKLFHQGIAAILQGDGRLPRLSTSQGPDHPTSRCFVPYLSCQTPWKKLFEVLRRKSWCPTWITYKQIIAQLNKQINNQINSKQTKKKIYIYISTRSLMVGPAKWWDTRENMVASANQSARSRQLRNLD